MPGPVDQELIATTAVVVGVLSLSNQCAYEMEREDAIITSIVKNSLHRSRVNHFYSLHRKCRQRQRWAEFVEDLTDRQFRRYFRMNKFLFHQLCCRIEEIVGEGQFKSEKYLDARLLSPPKRSNNMYHAHKKTTGGMLCGEIKLAITLRILGGGSYLDLAIIFKPTFNHANKLFVMVVNEWLCHPSFYPINGIDYVKDEDKMVQVATQFAQSSNGILNGCIGAIDGWVVKIKKPTKNLDKVLEPSSFYSRKGYYGLNVQCIVDQRKRFLYRTVKSRGAEHDSTAFKNSTLYKYLIENWEKLVQQKYFFVGDSAYALKSFLHTPYDNAYHGTPEDNYNYFHSSSRISVECAFGEVDLRWGIFWKPLKYTLRTNCKVIDACLRLHNYIVDHREELGMDIIDKSVFDDECRRVFAISPEMEGVFGGEADVRRDLNGNVSRGGRPSTSEGESTAVGKEWRDMHRDQIERRGHVRPRVNWFRDRNRCLYI